MSDPVADFLAREQDMLAEIEGTVPPPAPVIEDEPQVVELAEPVVEAVTENLADLDFGEPVSAPAPVIPAVNSESLISSLTNGHSSSAQLSSNGGSLNPSPVIPKIEAENIRIWKEEQRVKLEKKDAEEKRKIDEWKTNAAKELEDWYKQRDAALKLTHEANKKAEEEHLAAFSREQGEGAQWDEIAKLCEAKAQKGGKDISRLKTLLLHLKDRNAK